MCAQLCSAHPAPWLQLFWPQRGRSWNLRQKLALRQCQCAWGLAQLVNRFRCIYRNQGCADSQCGALNKKFSLDSVNTSSLCSSSVDNPVYVWITVWGLSMGTGLSLSLSAFKAMLISSQVPQDLFINAVTTLTCRMKNLLAVNPNMITSNVLLLHWFFNTS